MNLKALYYYHLLRTIELPEREMYLWCKMFRIYYAPYEIFRRYAKTIKEALK